MMNRCMLTGVVATEANNILNDIVNTVAMLDGAAEHQGEVSEEASIKVSKESVDLAIILVNISLSQSACIHGEKEEEIPNVKTKSPEAKKKMAKQLILTTSGQVVSAPLLTKNNKVTKLAPKGHTQAQYLAAIFRQLESEGFGTVKVRVANNGHNILYF
ncbi:uncharacterized protein [Clytia hemisphaerica]